MENKQAKKIELEQPLLTDQITFNLKQGIRDLLIKGTKDLKILTIINIICTKYCVIKICKPEETHNSNVRLQHKLSPLK